MSAPRIHPTAIIAPDADIATDVEIGAFAIVGEGCTIESGCVIAPRATLERNVLGLSESGIVRCSVVHPGPQ